jgi:hypothetical protein
MTTSLFRITPTPPISVKLEPGQEGKFSFTIESLAAPDKVHEVILQAQRVGEDGKGKEVDWLVVRPQQTLSMSSGKTETVSITARPTPTTPRGEHSIKLVVAEKSQPNEVFADSPPVSCEVSGLPPPPHPLKLWLILAIVGGVLLVVGGVVLVVKFKAPAVKAGAPCEGTCPEPLQCSTVTKRCVKQIGQPCDSNNQCTTGLCEGSVCAEATPDRNCTKDGVCGPDQKCLEVQPGVKRCGWNPGHVCTANAECTSQWCNQRTCSRDDGKCDSERDCRSPYECNMAKRQCLLPVDAQCGGDMHKSDADLNEVNTQLTVVRNEQEAAKLGVDSALANKRSSDASADTRRIIQATKDLHTAEDLLKAADARVKYYEAYRDFMQRQLCYTQEVMYWREAQYELAKAQTAQKNSIALKGVSYDTFSKQEQERSKRSTLAKERLDLEKQRAMSARDNWLKVQGIADRESGHPSNLPDPLAPKSEAATTGSAGPSQ